MNKDKKEMTGENYSVIELILNLINQTAKCLYKSSEKLSSNYYVISQQNHHDTQRKILTSSLWITTF